MRWLVRLLQIFAALILTLLVLLNIALPYFIGEPLRDFLYQQGARNVSLGDVEANLFSGRLAVHQLRFTDAEQQLVHITYASIKISLLALMGRQLTIDRINLYQSELSARISDDVWVVAGFRLPRQGEPSNNDTWPIALREIDGRDIELLLQMDQQRYPLQLHRLAIHQHKRDHAEINIAIQHNDAELRAKGELAWQPSLSGDLQLQVQNLTLQNYTRYLPMPDTLHIEGVFDAQLLATLHDQNLTLQGELISHELLLLMPASLTLAAGSARWEGEFSYHPEQTWQLLGDLSLQQAFLQNEQMQFRYIRTDNINARELTLQGTEQIGTPEIIAQHVDILGAADSPGRKGYLLSADEIRLEENSLNHLKLLQIGDASISGAVMRMTITKEGQLQELQSMRTPLQVGEKAAEMTVTEEPFVYRIGQLNLGNDSRLQFTDNSITPNFTLLARPLDVEITNVDSQADETGKLILSTMLNRFSSLEMEGEMIPLAPAQNTQLTLKLKNFDLPAISGYSAKQGGFNIKRGLLSSDSTIRIEQKKLKIDNKINIDNFALENLLRQQEQNEELGHVGMPLNQALTLLRNKEGDVKFNLPVRGDLDKPDISFRDITQQAVKSASQGAAIIVLQQFMQPWSSIFALAKLTIGQIATTQLQPVTFTPNDKQLSEEMQAYVKRLSELLQQKQELRLEMCGVSSKQDAAAILQKTPELNKEQLNQMLLKLADQRSQLIKQTLVDQYQISAGRLFSCQSRIDDNQKGQARVDLGV